MKEQRYYVCSYCHKDYEPKRRRVQKYCSHTCRSKAHHARNTTTNKVVVSAQDVGTPTTTFKTKNKVDAMSAAGVANAAAGTLAADAIKSVMTLHENKPATKGDLKKFVSDINGRYHLVKNIPPRYDGALPHFDFDTGLVVYFNTNIQ